MEVGNMVFPKICVLSDYGDGRHNGDDEIDEIDEIS